MLSLNTYIKEYEVTLKQYKEIFASLQSASSSLTNEWIQLKNRAFWGSQGTLETVEGVGTVDECQQLCQANSKCSGATYQEGGTCMLQSGMSIVSPAPTATATAASTSTTSSSYYAIVPKYRYYLQYLQYLNQKLQELNTTIQDGIHQYSSGKGANITKKYNELKDDMYAAYCKLTSDQEYIKKKELQSQEVQDAYAQAEHIVDSDYLQYRIWIIVLLVVVAVVFQAAMGLPVSQGIIVLILLYVLYTLNLWMVLWIAVIIVILVG